MLTVLLAVGLFLPDLDTAPRTPDRPPMPFGGPDFKQYYATSRLLVERRNPYNQKDVWEIQEPLGAAESQVPYGPPTSLLPFILLGWLDFPTACQVFFVANIVMMVVSCFLWGRMLFPEREWLALAAVAAVILWTPNMSLFWLGQVTTFPLLGFTLWAALYRENRYVWAGVALALSIVKPHLAAGPVLYACLVGLRQRRFDMLLALIVTVLAMIWATLLIRPTMWEEYLRALPGLQPTQWHNATLDGWGRLMLEQYYPGTQSEWFRYVSSALAVLFAGWIGILAWRHPANSVNALLAVTLWVVATPYAFSYDFVLLVPAFILAFGNAVTRTRPPWAVVALGWVVLDVSYYVMKARGAAHGWYEVHFFFIPWGALALTLLLLPLDNSPKTENAKRG